MAALTSLKQCPPISTMPKLALQHDHIPNLASYPDISLKDEIANPYAYCFASGVEPHNLIVHVNETVLKRITRTFFEKGFWESLLEACNDKTRAEAPWICKTADCIVKVVGLYNIAMLKIFPYTQKQSIQQIAEHVETRDWNNSCIRYIAWHLHFFKLAVAGLDDIIRIYKKNSYKPTILKDSMQSDITCMAWRPLCPSTIIVGCRNGLLLWTIDSNFHLTRSATQNKLLKPPSNSPVTSLNWNENGTLLVTASIGDRSILIWNIDHGKVQALKRMGPSISMLKWSPNNEWLFASTVGHVFRVWDCKTNWNPERWTCKKGTIQAACWSPCSKYLIFANTTEPILYRLQFSQHLLNASQDSKELLPIADLNVHVIDSSSQLLVGGTPQQLAWDPHGDYLVVSFKATNCLAIFRTRILKFDLQISAAYYLSGETPAEYPGYICFQPLYKPNDRSVLTIGWTTGRVQYYAFD